MIYLASDHAGFRLKEAIKAFLEENDIEFADIGPETYDQLDDYPDYAIPAAMKVAENPEEHRGIILGGSGQGEAMAANKVKGIRAVVFYGGSQDIVTLSKEHNDANVLALGARFLDLEEARQAVRLWLETPFSKEERHLRRTGKIRRYEIRG